MRLRALIIALSFLAIAAEASPVPSEPEAIVLKVLDVKSGKPVSNNHVLVMFSKKNDASRDRVVEAQTNADGLVLLPANLFHDYTFAQVWVDWHARCAHDINTRWHSTAVVVSKGLVVNDCNAAQLEVKPGQVTVGVRDETLWERMAH